VAGHGEQFSHTACGHLPPHNGQFTTVAELSGYLYWLVLTVSVLTIVFFLYVLNG
jgi:hypothetical protein